MYRSALPALLVLITACRNNGPDPNTGGITNVVDADSDGFSEEEDCDDQDATVNPGAEELCDGVDNNCDGTLDEGVQTRFYLDADGDGYGESDTTVEACAAPDGYVSNADDCNDLDADSYPDAAERCDQVDNDCDDLIDEDVLFTWYADADGDSYGDLDSAFETCDPPPGYVENFDDCDDTEPQAFPGSAEVCDEIDNDCDEIVDEDVTTTYYQDADGDNYGLGDVTIESCGPLVGYAARPGDCNDRDRLISPDAPERCDEIDNDCDALVDEPDAFDALTWYADADKDTYGDPDETTIACDQPEGTVANPDDCDDTADAIRPGADEVCNDIDDNCNGYIDDEDPELNDGDLWYIDYDEDGYGAETLVLQACLQPDFYVSNADDCDDREERAYPGNEEVCDGIDNDCDTIVDEDDATDARTWYADDDADGFGDADDTIRSCDAPDGYVGDNTDCDDNNRQINPDSAETWYDDLDFDCDEDNDPDPCGDLPEQVTVDHEADCGYDFAAPSAWSIGIEWSSDTVGYSAGGSYVEVMATPVVGQLTDDNADGVIDERDIPEVVYTTFSGSGYRNGGYLRVLSGDGSEEVLSLFSVGGYTIFSSSGVAIADVDEDGEPEILVHSTSQHVLAIRPDGTLKWASDNTIGSSYCHPMVHDIDADGSAEIISCNAVFDEEGKREFAIGGGISQAVADMDDDGDLEIVTSAGIYGPTGVLEQSLSLGQFAIGNFDEDDKGEIVTRDGADLVVYDDDGSILWEESAQGVGLPCVGDFDGDGEVEVGALGRSSFTVRDTDGSFMWSNSATDLSTGTMGCTSFDFDGDGASEVVLADRGDLYIWDGETGTQRYRNVNMASGSLYERAVIADVDNDGQAEIVFPSNNYSTGGYDGVFVLGERNGQWAMAESTHNQEAYAPGTVNGNMTVRSEPDAPWAFGWRASATPEGPPDAAPDWSLELLGACEDCVEGAIELIVAVENIGSGRGIVGATVEVSALEDGVAAVLMSRRVTETVAPGVRLAPMSFAVPIEDIGSGGLRVEINGDGAFNECDETNNQVDWDGLSCE